MRTYLPFVTILLALFIASAMDAVIKGLGLTLPVLLILSWRYFFGGALTVGLYVLARKPVPRWPAIRFHILRGAVQLFATGTFFYALTQLGLAQTTILGFTSALIVAPLAQLILGERMSRLSVAAALAGFGGVALAATAPGGTATGNQLYGVISVLLSAWAYALTIVLLRLRSRQEDALTVVTYTNVVSAIIMALILSMSTLMTGREWLPVDELPVLAGLAVAGVGVWWMMSFGYARAPAQRLVPLEYTALIWSAAFGLIFFDEAPGWRLYSGAVIIIGACLLVAVEQHFATRKATKLPTSDIPH